MYANKRDATTMTSITSDYYDMNAKPLNGQVLLDQKVFAIAKYMQRPITGYLLPFRVTWKGLTYKVDKPYRCILNNVSGSFNSGQIMAIMGPSGSGKSSLLSCITGLKKTGVTGAITISTKRKVIIVFN
jgi:ABC-type bacteriocin/lantibiotic exporter with double-glycine peptidase domain